MKTICAWCRSEIKINKDFEDHWITHGICKDCHDVLVEEIPNLNGKEGKDEKDN